MKQSIPIFKYKNKLPRLLILILIISLLESCNNEQTQYLIAKSCVKKSDGAITDEKVGIINIKGELITKEMYSGIDTIVSDENYFIGNLKDRGKQYFNIGNEKPLFDLELDEAYPFSDEGMAKVKYNRKWGFIDKEGKFVVPPLYEALGTFSEGLAAIAVESKIGFINNKGEIIIEPQFELSKKEPDNWAEWGIRHFQFKEDLCPVIIDDKFGYINKKGALVIKPIYKSATVFYKGMASVSLIDDVRLSPEKLPKSDFDILSNLVSDKYGIIDKDNKWIIKPSFGEIILLDDYFIAFTETNLSYFKKRKFSYFNYDGTQMFNKEFVVNDDDGNAHSMFQDNPLRKFVFSEGLAFVCTEDLCGYINKSGDFVIEPKYFFTNNVVFKNNFAVVGFNNKSNEFTGDDTKMVSYRPLGVINKDGHLVIPPVFTTIKQMENGIFQVIPIEAGDLVIKTSPWGLFYIDNKGNYIWNGYKNN